MILTGFSKMMFSSRAGWQELERIQPSVAKLFLFLVLPMSLLPPIMIGYAGLSYGNEYFADASHITWLISALIFLVAELLTVPLMAWAIKSIAATRNIQTHYHDTFEVASVAAVPLWLSSLALLLPSPLVVISIVLIGLFISVSTVYHGISGLLHIHDEIEDEAITYTTICLGVFAWAALGMMVFLPLMW